MCYVLLLLLWALLLNSWCHELKEASALVNLMVGMSFTACRERYSSDGCLYSWLRESWEGKLVFFDKLIGGERILSNSTQPSYSWLCSFFQLPEHYCNDCWIFSRCGTCTCMYSLCMFLTFPYKKVILGKINTTGL